MICTGYLVQLHLNVGAVSLFAVTGIAHIFLIAFAIWRLKHAPEVAKEDKVSFQAKPMVRASTPETAALGADQAELDADQPVSSEPTETLSPKDPRE